MRPRPPASQGLRSANVARDKDVEQVRRLLSVKPTPKVAPASGGIVGVAEVYSQDGTIGGTDTSLTHGSVRYNDPTDPFDTGIPLDWIGFDAGNPSRMTLAVGAWYSVVVEFNFLWSSPSLAPEFFNPIIYFGGAGHDWDKLWMPRTMDQAGKKGLQYFMDIGPIFAQDEFTVLQAQCRWTAAGVAGTQSLDFPRIVWKVTKWS